MKKLVNNDVIQDSLIKIIQNRLSEGKQVRRSLPLKGCLHIDRMLPFLLVYRQPVKNSDTGTVYLVRNESSYLIGSTSSKMRPSLSKLVQTIAETLSQEKKAFLIIEIWPNTVKSLEQDYKQRFAKPGFRIFTKSSHSPTRTVEAFRKALKKIKLSKCLSDVEIVYQNKCYPSKLTPLVTDKTAKIMNWFTLGIEINPIYYNQRSGEFYPLVLRQLHHKLSVAIMQTVFEFMRSETSLRPKHYLALGKRRLVKAVWEVDSELAKINNLFDFLLQVSPINTESAWKRFKRSRFEVNPEFEYRPLPIDPSLVKKQLYSIPVERIEDPAIAYLFHEKRLELDRKLNMLTDQGTPNFLYGSLQLFGNVSQEQINFARYILDKLPSRTHDEKVRYFLNATQFAKRAKDEIEYYHQKYSGFKSTVHIRKDVSGLVISQGNLLIGDKIKIPISRVEAILQHEVGTHVLTYHNGRFQPLKQLYTGLSNYNEIQEGLAVIAEYLVGGLTRPRLRLLAGRVIATYYLVNGASFVETFRELESKYNFKQYTAFSITTRVYRSGGLTKDAVYLRSLINILKHIKDEADFNILFIGKISFSHIPLIKELIYRQVLKQPPLLPRYLDNPQSIERLNILKRGMTVLDLIERK